MKSRFETSLTTPTKSTWSGLWKKVNTIAPFLWPKKNYLLQLVVVICFLLLAIGRIANLYTPIFSKLIINSLSTENGNLVFFRWDLVVYYVGLKVLQGGSVGNSSILGNLRAFLWIKVEQYTGRTVQLKLLSHLHNLSLRWHLNRKTGEMLKIMDRGTGSINDLLNIFLFQIFPTLIDMIIAVTYFVVNFDIYFGIIIFTTMVLYLIFTITITEWRTKFQRRMNIADNEANAKSVDSLLNFETVKYYGNEKYEVESFKEKLLIFQKAEFASLISQNIMSIFQNVTVNTGILIGSILCMYKVVETKELTVGDYVLFSSYIAQLNGPLNFFGLYYRSLQGNFVNMENLLDLLKQEPEVKNVPNAQELSVKEGSIEFQNVNFSYNVEPILKNLSFKVPPGKTLALVGPSGSGKSTVIRLLFRFYDIQSGSILIDDNKIDLVSQESLRKAIGVVPQETVLFNNTIKYNIKYGRLSAEDSDVLEAARGADIHEKILTFNEGYETQVGERGLRLSGGEKQRVAIARTILKTPPIVLLDEATSALDSQTERHIQESLNRMCANRTTIIVAHRLSTIVHADEILVLKEGSIVERGRHDDLVGQNGIYASMWNQQLNLSKHKDSL